MKKIKYLFLLIVWLLWIGISFWFYADLTSINPVWWSVYNVPYCFYSDTVNIFNNWSRISWISEGAYNTSITWFVSTNENSFIWNGYNPWFANSYYWNNNFIIFNWKSFWFWTSYNSIVSDYSVYNDPWTYWGVRLFFDTPIGSVWNNPLLNFNTNNLNSTWNLPVKWFEFFTPWYTYTNYWYLFDYWIEGTKWRHFWLDSWGYSYWVNFSDDSSKINWSSFSFSSLWSESLLGALRLWLTSFDNLTSNNTLSLWILVLKNNWYDFNQWWQWKYLLLSKNPDSYSGLLYEIFDCNSYQWTDRLPNIMTDSKCTSLSHWTIDWILPFTDSWSVLNVSDLWGFLGYIFNTSELYWFSYFTDTTLKFNAFVYGGGCGWGYYNYCRQTVDSYTLNPDSSVPSIKELYLDGWWTINQVWWTLISDIIINKPSDYYTYSWLLEYSFSWSFYSWVDSSFWYVDSSGNFVFWSGLLVSTWWNSFPDLKNLKFWVCPFYLDWELPSFWFEDFSFDLLVPFKCIAAAGKAWMNYTNSFPLFSYWFNSPLIEDPFFSNFIWSILIFGVYLIVFKFIKHLR